MGGALTQLAAYGAQDVYLTGNPQMAFPRENFTNSFTLKRTAIFASAASLAILSFFLTRDIRGSL